MEFYFFFWYYCHCFLLSF